MVTVARVRQDYDSMKLPGEDSYIGVICKRVQ